VFDPDKLDDDSPNCMWQTTLSPTTLSPTTLSPTTLSPQVYNNVKIKVYISQRYMYIESNIGNLNNKSISINGSEPIKVECDRRRWGFGGFDCKRKVFRGWRGLTRWTGIKYYPKDQNNNYYTVRRTPIGIYGGSAGAFNYNSTVIRTVNITVYN